MTVIDILSKSKAPVFSFELLPPIKGHTLQSVFDTIEPLLEYNPAYINVTYHREEAVYTIDKTGYPVPRIVRRRPGTVGIATAIQAKYNIDVVPHIVCGGFTKSETEDALIDLDFLGIHNVLAVRGDADKITGKFEQSPFGHLHTVDLVRQINYLNHGHYLEETLEQSSATKFCVGVAGYPEKHAESPNPIHDLRHLKLKVDAGAQYIVTQMFFDNQVYFNFVANCREAGIKVPIIPGIKPISTKSQLSSLSKTFSIQFPQELVAEVEKCSTNEQVRQVGIEWAIFQAENLYLQEVPAIHFYTMGKSDNIRDIVRHVF